MKTAISFAVVVASAAFALAVPAPSAFAAQGADPLSFAQVLQEVKTHGAQANEDAEVLNSFARSNLAWQSHAWCLGEIQRHVNDLTGDYSRLRTLAETATPQQLHTINRLEPLVREMTRSLEKTIQLLAENQKQVNMPSFRTRIHSDYVNINTLYRELCDCSAKALSQG